MAINVNDRVTIKGAPAHVGTVIEVYDQDATIHWDDDKPDSRMIPVVALEHAPFVPPPGG